MNRRLALHVNQVDGSPRVELGDFLTRAALWGGIGSLGGLKGSKMAGFALLGPIAEKVLGFRLEDIAAAAEREYREQEKQKAIARLQAAWQSIRPKTSLATTQPALPLPVSEASVSASQPHDYQEPAYLQRDNCWLRVIVHPSVVVILGRRGSGKSGLGYRLLELFRYKLTPCVLGIPKQAQRFLPDWIGVFQNLQDIPRASIVLVDEAYLWFHARESQTVRSKEMSRLINLSRQRELTLVFVTQQARQLDLGICSGANVLVFKDPGLLQAQFDRPELRSVAAQAERALEAIDGDKRAWSYVYSPDADFSGPMENSLPSFWSTRLSHAFAVGGTPSDVKLPKKVTLQERIQKAKELHYSVVSYRKIADVLGVSKSSVHNYINGYPNSVQ